MKSRAEVAAFIRKQFDHDCYNNPKKAGKHHYGYQDARDLLDFIYDGEPLEGEELEAPDYIKPLSKEGNDENTD